MKKAVKIISLALVVVIVGAMLASCSKILSGTYSYSGTLSSVAKTSYSFSGSNVTITATIDLGVLGSSTKEYKGKYEITKAADGSESITFTFEGEDSSSYNGTYSFEEGKNDAGVNTITIGKITYTKQ